MQFINHQELNATTADIIQKSLLDMDFNDASSEQIYKMLSRPPKSDMGDLAFSCFMVAKQLKKAPNQIAADLADKINEANSELLDAAKAFGPYVNFFFNPAIRNKAILDSILSGTQFKQNLVKAAPKTIVEYSQPNTHKELHVGHMRNLCLGDALVKIYRYAGIPTLATTFPGDVGTHVAKCLWYYKKHNKEEVPTERKGAWLGTLYTKGNNLLEDQRGTEHEASNREELTKILKELHAGSGEYYDLWKETREWSVELMQSVYDWAGVKFDSWYWESDVDVDSVSLVKKYFNQGLFIEDQGAVGIDLKDEKLGFCLLLKSDGTGLYATKDLELARRKFEDHQIEKSIYVVDNRQALHFKQVFKTLEKMGFENAKNCYHLQYEMVELTDGAMSSRKGNIVPLQALIDKMQNHIKTEYLKKYEGEWDQKEIDDTAKIVAEGAIKYGMTRIDSNKKIVFDMQEWLKLDGESGPYIQYVYARINSMLEKLNYDNTTAVNYQSLTHKLESELVLKLGEFNAVVENCIENHKTHPLCALLYEIAKAFNAFYAECSVQNAESEDLKVARMALAKATATGLKQGLSLLGISAPYRM